MNKKKRFPFSIPFIILIILFAGIIVINIYLDRVVLEHIVPEIERLLDRKILVDGLGLGPYGIKIDGLKIIDKNEQIFSADSIYIYFSLKPLLNKEFIIDHITIKGPIMAFYHQPDGSWVSPVFIKEEKITQKGLLKIELKKIFIEKGEIKIVDNITSPPLTTYFKKTKGYFELGERVTYEIDGFVENTQGKINILGTVESGTGVYKVHFNGKNLDGVKFKPYYQPYFNYPVEKGIIKDINLVFRGDKNAYRNEGEISVQDLDFKYWPDQKPVHADKVKIIFHSSPNIVLLDEISGVLTECAFKVRGKVWPAAEGKDRYELSLNLEGMDMDMAKERYIYNPGLKRDLNITGKGELNFTIKVDGDNFQYTGGIDIRDSELDWGKILFKPRAKTCYVNFNLKYKKDEKVSGNFRFNSDQVKVTGEGELTDLINTEPKLDLNLSLVDGKVEDLLIFFPPWPSDIKLFGKTDKLNVKILSSQGQTIYSFRINGTPLEWRYAKLFLKPQGMESDIIFNLVPEQNRLFLTDSRLTFGSSEVKMSKAAISPQDAEGLKLNLDFSKLVFDDARKISDIFKWEDLYLDGFCAARFNLAALKEQITIDGIANVYETQIKYKNLIGKNIKVASKLRFNLSWKGDTFFIKGLELESGRNKLSFQGEVTGYNQEQPQYKLNILSEGFYWGELVAAQIPGLTDYKLEGKSNIKFELTGQKKFLNINGELDLTSCKTRWENLLKKAKGEKHKINFNFLLGQNNFVVKSIDITLGDFKVTGEGKIENYNKENPKLFFTWKTEELDGEKMYNFLPFDFLKSIEMKGLMSGDFTLYKEDNMHNVKGEIDSQSADIYYKNRFIKPSGIKSNFIYSIRLKEGIFSIDTSQYTFDQSVFNINGKIQKAEENWATNLTVTSDKLFLKEILPYFSRKMAGELEDLTFGGPGKINLTLDNTGGKFSWQGEIDLKDNYLTYKQIIAKPEGLDSKLIFKILTEQDSINFDTLRFIWNNSRVDFTGKIANIKTEPSLDLSLTSDMFYPELKMIIADSSEGEEIKKKFYNFRDDNEKISLNLKITGKIENPEIKSDWGLITAVAIKIGLSNSMEFLEKATGKTLETTLNFGRKTVETTVLIGGKVLRETVRAGISVIEGVFKIIWPFNK